jgi:hypothetical protein
MAKFKVICLFFGLLILVNPLSSIYAKNNCENLPFDVKQVIEQVTPKQKPHHNDHRTRSRKIPNRINKSLQDEFMIDTSQVFTPGGYEPSAPAITFDGNNYFVVWGDYIREAVMGTRVNQVGEILDKPNIKIITAYCEWELYKPAVAYGDGIYLSVWTDHDREIIFSARTSTAGVPLDTIPIPICTTYYNGYQTSVAFDGSNFLVVWSNDDDVIGARISPSGIVLDTLGIIISNALGDQFEPTICFGGSNYFVTWVDTRTFTTCIYGTRVSPEGIVLDPNGIRISPLPLRDYRPVITFGGSNYFVVWETEEEFIYGARIDQNGTVLDTSGIAISPSFYPSWFPAVTFDGINYLAVWEDIEEENLYGRRIDTNGIVVDTGRILICTFQETYYPAVVFGGSYSLVVWDDFRIDNADIFGARVNNQGIVLDSAGIPVSLSISEQEYSKVVFDGTNYLVIWRIRTELGPAIQGVRVSPAGITLDSTTIHITPPTNFWITDLQVISGSNNYLVFWTNHYIGSGTDIYGVRISLNGVVLDTMPIPISIAQYHQGNPNGVYGGNNYFIVWTDGRSGINYDIYGTRVTQNGVVLDPEGIPISTADDDQRGAQVVFDGPNYFVFWADGRNGSIYNPDIYGTRVNTSGLVLDTVGIPISTSNNSQDHFSIAFDGDNYLLVWEDSRNGNYFDIYGARVTPNGVVLDTVGIPISISNNYLSNPKVVFGDNKYLAVWVDYNNVMDNNDIYGARLTTEGFVLDTSGIPIATGEYRQFYPQVIFDGTYYEVIWQSVISGGWENDIYGARIHPISTRIDSFEVSNQTGFLPNPAIVRGPDNQIFIIYTSWTNVYQGKPYYTDRIWGKFAPAPGIEETKVVTDINSPIFMNLPNPFNQSTSIKYTIRKSGDFSLKVFDITGKLVRNLVNGNKEPGIYSTSWDGTDDLNQKLPAGVYFYQLKTSNETSETKELIILR